MNILKVFSEEIKGNGVAPLPTPHTPAIIAPLPTVRPKKRKSLFAHQIWSVENKPRFACSSIYGFAG